MASGAPAAASAATPVSPVFMALLVGMTAAAPLSMQIFVPALPAIQRGFAVPTGVAQLALSLSILANAFATLSYGPMSDRFGRRPAVLVGLGLFVAGSVMCALAPTIGFLILGRIVQAAGAAAGMVIARAIVRDLYDRDRAASMIAYLTMAMVVAPMLAPSVGAILMDLAGWRAIFVALTVAGIMLLWSARLRLIETRGHGGPRARPPDRRRQPAALAGVHQLRPAERVLDEHVLRVRLGRAVFHDRRARPARRPSTGSGSSSSRSATWPAISPRPG